MEPSWSVQDSLELYQLPYWGRPFFSINDTGNVTVRPQAKNGPRIDLKALVDDLCRRGIEPPILIRFNDILQSRIQRINEVFQNSISKYGYRGRYRSVMPIKVNQQRHVVEELVRHGTPFNLGLEAGSKPELLIAIALLEGQQDGFLICNGYKDEEYIETAMESAQLGLHPILVLDRFAELDTIIRLSRKLQLTPHIGIRAKLSTRGSGHWEKSSGDQSKFGLNSKEIVEAVKILKENNMLSSLELLHFHIGSQVTAIRSLKEAVREGAYIYSNLRRLGATQLDYVDVGGGLAIDYDGSQTNFHSSKNYSTQEYANDIVAILHDICDATDTPHPTIISESGRSLVAHHSVLIFNVLGVHQIAGGSSDPLTPPGDDDHYVLHELWEAHQDITRKNFQEAYNDAVALKEQIGSLFGHGVLNLETKARCDDLFWAVMKKVQEITKETAYVPDDIKGLTKLLSDTYFCNFSIFQSLPDAWALHHLFPIIPIHRHDEVPTNHATLADLTCDSDGKLDQFISIRDVQETLPLHPPNGQPYYLGAFLVGAYQEILGDLHNLFGDTNAVHVSLEEDGSYKLDHLVEGDTVKDVLEYVEYDCTELTRRVRRATESAVKSNRMSFEQAAKFVRRFQEGLSGYTYLEGIDRIDDASASPRELPLSA